MFFMLIALMVAILYGFVKFGGKKPCGCKEGEASP